MEVKGATLLYALAGVMITFGGFSSLLLAIRPAGAGSSVLDRYLAKTVMTHIFVLTGAALLPLLFALYDVPEKWNWRVSAVIFGVPMLLLQVTYPYRRRRAVGSGPPPPIFAVLVVFGALVTAAMLGSVLADLPHAAAAYITAVTVNFFTVLFCYLVALDVILHQADGAAKRG